MYYILGFLLFALGFSACQPTEVFPSRPGYRPLYAPRQEVFRISVEPPRSIGTLGKIYVKDSLLLVNELNKGIHVYNNSNTADPRPLFFIRIPGNKDIAMRESVLYADNFSDLVLIDLSDFSNIREISRVPELYPSTMFLRPETQEIEYFECVDTSKGLPIDWEFVPDLDNPSCRTR